MADAGCPVCGRAFPSGRRRFCSAACRQAAWRRRRTARPPAPAIPPRASRPPRSDVVYECPVCGARYLGEQRCADCQRFCRRVGLGGRCPHCDEPVAVDDLINLIAYDAPEEHEGR
jgi:predicted nucleic acid-binding Zn ribbon protein